MRLFDFFKRKLKFQRKSKLSNNFKTEISRLQCTGKDFEFLITGDIDVFADFDSIMTPNTFDCIKIFKDGWNYYQVGKDEFSYSIEPPGIQMTFNNEITFSKAKKIGDEIVKNINVTGQKAELVIIDKGNAYRFN